MSIDRVATNNQTSYMLAQIARRNADLQNASEQVASGKITQQYTGIGDKTAALEGARAASDRAGAYVENTKLALTQTDLQDTQLTALTGLATQLQKALQNAIANSDGTGLMATANDIFNQAASILNATDANGNYLYAGETSDVKPFTATKLSDLNTGNVTDYFADGTIRKTILVGDGQTEQIGVLASDIGVTLMQSLKALYQADQTTSLSSTLTATQTTNLTDNVLPGATAAYNQLNQATAQNGDMYNTLKTATTNQQSLQNLYTGFVSDIEDIDMATALTNLSNSQTALQAVLTVTAQLNQLSLLKFLPTA